MLQLKEKLMHYSEQHDLLKSFRNSMENELKYLEITLNSIEDDIRKIYSSSSKSEEEIFQHLEEHRFECDRSTFDEVLPILNGLNISFDEIPRYPFKEQITEDYEETVYYYDYKDILSRLKELDDYMYLVTMIYIYQNFDNYEIWAGIPNRVKSVLRQLNIKIPNYGKTVFIAMSFNEELLGLRGALCSVLESNGFKPIIIDSKEHNNQIVPEIFFEINKAEFVIVDLTDHRTGVYYEAGYAKGVGKEVIFTCKKDDFANRHFDVAQTNTIVWENENQLKQKLDARIEAMYLLETVGN
ncbi:hypothetical protein [Lysinibacillus fusiformis]|uniref:hypothetical protein n=1 Tax=Lysinibacillus fusiformis TaxID=28031 RepID=UPI00068920D8|nr:hypothetical protein [Lysinibacillus fusiformis]